jgi:MFS transporter, FSR family, fosmidomycin resistance protein
MFTFWVTLTLASMGMQSFLVTALVTVQGIELAAATMVLTVLLATGAAGILCGGYLADRTQRHALLVAGALAACAGLSVLGGYVPLSAVALIVLFGVVGFLQGTTRPSRDIMVRQITPERDIGKVFAFVTTGINVGGAIAPFLFGLILDHGDPRWIFAGLGLFFIAGIATMGTTRLYAKPLRAPAPAE